MPSCRSTNNVKVLKTFEARTQTRENNPVVLYFVDPAPDSWQKEQDILYTVSAMPVVVVVAVEMNMI